MHENSNLPYAATYEANARELASSKMSDEYFFCNFLKLAILRI